VLSADYIVRFARSVYAAFTAAFRQLVVWSGMKKTKKTMRRID
jgi:hypothetical protein